MNGKDLYFAVADIEEKWIEESEAKEKKHLNLKYIIPIAACFAIAAAVAAVYNFGGRNTPIQPQSNTEYINRGYAVSEKAADEQTEEKNTVENGTDTDSENKEIPKTNPDAVNDGINLTAGGNGYYLSIADNGKAPTYKTVIFKADDGIVSGGRSDALVPKAGEVFISPGLSETMKNHAGEDVYYSVVFEMYGVTTSSSEELEKESDRLYKWCQENGYENCVFSTSKVTFPDGTTNCELRGEMVTAEFINNFPAGDCGYWIRFPSEFL